MRAILFAWGLFAVVAAAQSPSEQLQQELGRDPAELLRAIGSAKDHEAARAAMSALELDLRPRANLALLRFGFGHADERVVFGAAVWNGGEALPVPELRHAAATILPRFGDADCPVSSDELLWLCGSVDMPALLAILPKLDAKVAVELLDAAHRLLRSEHVPALCVLAQRAGPELARAALSNADLVARYADAHDELVLATWLRMAGVELLDGDPGLPPVLRTVLVRLAAAADPRNPVERLAARWLSRCTVAKVDQPLLLRLLHHSQLGIVAVRALPDPLAEGVADRVLAADGPLGASLQHARARAGDEAALAQLLAGDSVELSLGLGAASPTERRRFAERLLEAPRAEALSRLHEIAELARCEVTVMALAFDDAWLVDLEPLAAASAQLDVLVLRAMVAAVPTCATGRLADRLLAAPVDELFAPRLDGDSEPVAAWQPDPFRGELGFSGAWAFLEVARPERFRQRLREGLVSKEADTRDVCADLLLRLRDAESAPGLLAWALAGERSGEGDVPWLDLAACGGEAVLAEVRARLGGEGSSREARELWPALAVLQGMPEHIARYELDGADPEVHSLLLAGRPAQAYLQSGVELSPAVATWSDREVQRHVDSLLPDASIELQWTICCLRGDAESRRIVRELCRDGRYAAQHGLGPAKGAGRDLSDLSFWIDECGTNCCRYIDSAHSVLIELFGSDPAYSMDQWPVPLVTRLRQRLLPLQARLRWSTLANGYVVAGN